MTRLECEVQCYHNANVCFVCDGDPDDRSLWLSLLLSFVLAILAFSRWGRLFSVTSVFREVVRVDSFICSVGILSYASPASVCRNCFKLYHLFYFSSFSLILCWLGLLDV